MEALTTEQLGRLIYRVKNEPRRNAKRWLKDLGGTGSADELDKMLAIANSIPAAVAEFERLEAQRRHAAKAVESGIDGHVAEMLADIRVRMSEQSLTQQDVAERCGWPQSLVAAYLTGAKEPGIGNLAKLASSLGLCWRLVKS